MAQTLSKKTSIVREYIELQLGLGVSIDEINKSLKSRPIAELEAEIKAAAAEKLVTATPAQAEAEAKAAAEKAEAEEVEAFTDSSNVNVTNTANLPAPESSQEPVDQDTLLKEMKEFVGIKPKEPVYSSKDGLVIDNASNDTKLNNNEKTVEEEEEEVIDLDEVTPTVIPTVAGTPTPVVVPTVTSTKFEKSDGISMNWFEEVEAFTDSSNVNVTNSANLPATEASQEPVDLNTTNYTVNNEANLNVGVNHTDATTGSQNFVGPINVISLIAPSSNFNALKLGYFVPSSNNPYGTTGLNNEFSVNATQEASNVIEQVAQETKVNKYGNSTELEVCNVNEKPYLENGYYIPEFSKALTLYLHSTEVDPYSKLRSATVSVDLDSKCSINPLMKVENQGKSLIKYLVTPTVIPTVAETPTPVVLPTAAPTPYVTTGSPLPWKYSNEGINKIELQHVCSAEAASNVVEEVVQETFVNKDNSKALVLANKFLSNYMPVCYPEVNTVVNDNSKALVLVNIQSLSDMPVCYPRSEWTNSSRALEDATDTKNTTDLTNVREILNAVNKTNLTAGVNATNYVNKEDEVSINQVAQTQQELLKKIFLSIENGNLENFYTLIADLKDVNARDDNGDTLLIWAINSGYIEIVKYLVENGANVNLPIQYGYTPLISAINYDVIEVVKYLVEKGADLNLADEYGDTPLIAAAYKGFGEIVKALLDKGADATQRNLEGLTAKDVLISKIYKRDEDQCLPTEAEESIISLLEEAEAKAEAKAKAKAEQESIVPEIVDEASTEELDNDNAQEPVDLNTTNSGVNNEANSNVAQNATNPSDVSHNNLSFGDTFRGASELGYFVTKSNLYGTTGLNNELSVNATQTLDYDVKILLNNDNNQEEVPAINVTNSAVNKTNLTAGVNSTDPINPSTQEESIISLLEEAEAKAKAEQESIVPEIVDEATNYTVNNEANLTVGVNPTDTTDPYDGSDKNLSFGDTFPGALKLGYLVTPSNNPYRTTGLNNELSVNPADATVAFNETNLLVDLNTADLIILSNLVVTEFGVNGFTKLSDDQNFVTSSENYDDITKYSRLIDSIVLTNNNLKTLTNVIDKKFESSKKTEASILGIFYLTVEENLPKILNQGSPLVRYVGEGLLDFGGYALNQSSISASYLAEEGGVLVRHVAEGLLDFGGYALNQSSILASYLAGEGGVLVRHVGEGLVKFVGYALNQSSILASYLAEEGSVLVRHVGEGLVKFVGYALNQSSISASYLAEEGGVLVRHVGEGLLDFGGYALDQSSILASYLAEEGSVLVRYVGEGLVKFGGYALNQSSISASYLAEEGAKLGAYYYNSTAKLLNPMGSAIECLGTKVDNLNTSLLPYEQVTRDQLTEVFGNNENILYSNFQKMMQDMYQYCQANTDVKSKCKAIFNGIMYEIVFNQLINSEERQEWFDKLEFRTCLDPLTRNLPDKVYIKPFESVLSTPEANEPKVGVDLCFDGFDFQGTISKDDIKTKAECLKKEFNSTQECMVKLFDIKTDNSSTFNYEPYNCDVYEGSDTKGSDGLNNLGCKWVSNACKSIKDINPEESTLCKSYVERPIGKASGVLNWYQVSTCEPNDSDNNCELGREALIEMMVCGAIDSIDSWE